MAAITIVLPIYNAESFLDSCMEMLIAQDFKDFEIIAINDGSSDSSWELLSAWAQKEQRLRIFNQENKGAGETRNFGLDAAQGEYIIFLDPDDTFKANLLSKLYTAAQNAQADIAICASAAYDLETKEIIRADWALRKDLAPKHDPFAGKDAADDIFRIAIGWPWDKLIKRSFLLETGLRYPDIKNSEDGVLIFPALCLAQRITLVTDILIHHTTNRSDSLSYLRKDNALCFYQALILVRHILTEKGEYSVFERGFMNWAVDFCSWNINTAHPDDKREIYDFLVNKGIDELGIFDHPESYYFKVADYNTIKCMTQYSFPECLIIAELGNEVTTIKDSRPYRLGEAIAKPIRAFRNLLAR